MLSSANYIHSIPYPSYDQRISERKATFNWIIDSRSGFFALLTVAFVMVALDVFVSTDGMEHV
ncbi:hypothetical protein Acife_2571 [Acidithiobacillus ferrivorans SS3]|uniref:Uncharacterized protein n=1 Tax=Acidithiobacillus ferrivorans SS3 TaxID=743299 RepID=G0JQM0_9PROT|nr:hypothetical protein Acife_2571 [Acidithiobacillus ferrivorans SS3]OFA15770.1 hypothetical protein A4U49_11340 [Acidithiobacillus ferrivorans]